MEGSIANQDEAEKCRDLAKSFMTKGEYSKASKFFEKSLKLFVLPGVTALKLKADQLAAQQQSGGSSSSRGSTSGDSNTAASSGTPSSGGSRSYTPEQESGAKKILTLSKKSHYEVLGLEKDATQADIKKAYRKLALKFHPDKNSAPNAEGAFKAINTAFDTLSDPSKREVYDQYGHEGEAQMRQQGGSGSDFMGGMHGFRGFGGSGREVSPEEIFNMFFQSAAGPGFRAQFGGRQFRQRPRQTPQREDEGAAATSPFLNYLFQLMPVILLVLMSLSSFGGQSSAPLYSFQPQGTYQIEKLTKSPGVSQDIKYYVNDQFDKMYRPVTDTYRRIERQIETDYKQALGYKCSNEKAYKSNRKYQARFKSAVEQQKADQLKTPACDELNERFQPYNF